MVEGVSDILDLLWDWAPVVGCLSVGDGHACVRYRYLLVPLEGQLDDTVATGLRA